MNGEYRKHVQMIVEATPQNKKKKADLMTILLKEQQNLISNLNVAGSDYNRKLDEKTLNQLRQLVGQHSLFKGGIAQRSQYMQEIEDQIKKV